MSDKKRTVNPSENDESQPPSRDDANSGHRQSRDRREAAVEAREDSVGLREHAVAAVEVAVQARLEVEQLNGQLLEANERLVVATVQAQTAEEHAEHANRLKDDFLATVSHELRTPLNAVLGWARMLKEKQLTTEREGHAVETIERNATSLAHIIDDLLDVSRIIAGTLHLTPQLIDLVAVTHTTFQAVKPLAVKRQIDLRFSPEPGATAMVSGDAARLQQVIWNLLGNAVKFTPEGGRVDVSVEPAGASVELNIVDTGQGIDPEFLPHVFERFRQAEGTPSRRHGGLGLGLAIVRQLVELHGGTVHAASAGSGRGATFTVRLPALAAGAQVERGPGIADRRFAGSRESPALRLPHLDDLRLVVDDDNDGRTLTTLVLTQAHASVKAVASAREALQALETERPDVLVSDIGLPDEDGYSLIRRIRHRETQRGGFLPAIALTGYARADDKIRALVAGFQAHVVKPLEPAELMAAITDVRGRSKSG
ncbi:MAG: hybrid sensor histidine kinase/response regulator [Acidobacteria bacterium]|nr:MAG: hybrid sensor histidine kinase/response regulator [Acidobacteriota bacterium]